ncbi:MAG: hypothetical protein WAV28_09575 [Sedimentisphaerales bacterium]
MGGHKKKGCTSYETVPVVRDDMYVERTGYANYDFDDDFWTKDGAWNELDLSAIVPAGASAIAVHSRCKASAINLNSVVFFRMSGQADIVATCKLRPQVIDVSLAALFVIGMPTNRKLEYRIIAAGMIYDLYFTVKGWWIVA